MKNELLRNLAKKQLLLVVLAIFLKFSICGCHGETLTPTGKTFELVYEYDGLEREYILYLPDGVYRDAPLIFVFHEYLGDAEAIMSYTNFKYLADEYGLVLCFPQGFEDNLGMSHWNANLTMSDVDDIGFITELAEELVDVYALNSSRVFACGFSNGGFMSYTLAMHASETFRATAAVAGHMSGYEWKHRHEAVPIPVLHIHGTSDRFVFPDGSMTTLGGWGGAPAVRDIVNFWAEVNGTDEAEVEKISDVTTAYYYRNGKDGNEVWYYEIKNYRHAWPRKGVNADFEGAELVWEFFSQY